MNTVPDHEYTRREYLLMRAVSRGDNWEEAREAVYGTAQAHPEWDMEERRTYSEWVKARGE